MTVDLGPTRRSLPAAPTNRGSRDDEERVVEDTDATRGGPRLENLVAAICSAVASSSQYAEMGGVAVSRSWRGQSWHWSATGNGP